MSERDLSDHNAIEIVINNWYNLVGFSFENVKMTEILFIRIQLPELRHLENRFASLTTILTMHEIFCKTYVATTKIYTPAKI